MSDAPVPQKPWGYTWRSSTGFILSCIIIALFAENFLYGFVVPILPYILEDRNHVEPSDTQRLTYQVLTIYGAVAVVSGLLIGHWADRINSRRAPLILGLGVALVGTIVLATSTKLPGLFIGRTLQAIGGTTAWIVGYATLRDTIEAKDMGKTFGLVNSFVSAGALSGPAVAGSLLELAGYWVTWSVVLVLLLLDIVMRFIMIEKRSKKANTGSGERGALHDDTQDPGNARSESEQIDSPTENTALLAASPEQLRRPIKKLQNVSAASFYRIILGQPRVVVALLSYMTHSSLVASYNTTLPTHVRQTFEWGSLSTGLLFVGLQAPAIVFSPICGWLRDRVGTRVPTAVGFLLLAPLLWLLGITDQAHHHWVGSTDQASRLYVVSIITIGCVQNLLTSVGTIEITCAVDDLESKHPGIFGPNGGYSRAYSLSNISFTMGLLVGPLVSGTLTDAFGYYYMNSVLAFICVVLSLLAITFLRGKSTPRGSDHNDVDVTSTA
ncbi:major facilitator superfamily domain-containing protein [Aspergillus bertholletiae]|uniref:Major facilitator superfamily domain-containing protein n=1 Tax=Aspergillus bertholletiae TaxID=1226010 RepID=A0A5N7BN87_9EURO|nr:major facilitator superfamily domain-containing protein [Aspergillus bertholletiae]